MKNKGPNNAPRVVVGLTGGMGSGKSTVASLLRERGIEVADADVIVHAALRPTGAGYRRVRALLGRSVVRADGTLDRARMARRVFADPNLRKKLEAILHPVVERELKKRMAVHRRGLLVLDVPLLFESGMDRLVDRTVVVWAPPRTCRARLLANGRFSPGQIRRRMAAQMSLSEKCRRADFVLNNGGSLKRLIHAVDQIFGAGIGASRPPLLYRNVTKT